MATAARPNALPAGSLREADPTRPMQPSSRILVLSPSDLATRQFSRYCDHLEFVRRARAALAGREFDLILANDAESWPLGLELRRRGRVLCDAHEYSLRALHGQTWGLQEELLAAKERFDFVVWRMISFGRWLLRFAVRLPQSA
jgi:hypothetical protein